MTELTINFLDESDPTALHCHYEGQSGQQPCWLYLNAVAGVLSAEYEPEAGPPYARPAQVDTGQFQRWVIPCLVTRRANRLLSELVPLAQVVVDGADQEWDGRNFVATYGAEAQAALEAIEQHCERLCDDTSHDPDVVEEYSPHDWWAGAGQDPVAELGITADTSDDQIHQLAAREATDALTGGDRPVVFWPDLEGYLGGLRDEARAEMWGAHA